jgi:deazaflavin-dependent oxidoreductase (nitroreductase family)
MGLYHRATERFLKTRAGGWTALHVMNPLDKRLMKWSNGKLSTAVGTDVRKNAVLLRCTGAKSGKARDVPLLATPFDDGWALIASATGVEKNPAWYHNLKAHPECSMIVPDRGEVACVAHEAEGAERERAWQAANAKYSGYTVYQGRTDRRIPVMVLVPEK